MYKLTLFQTYQVIPKYQKFPQFRRVPPKQELKGIELA